jgi:hypothetical protein
VRAALLAAATVTVVATATYLARTYGPGHIAARHLDEEYQKLVAQYEAS